MYPTLFQLAGLAMAGWALLILLPRWGLTRWLAETAAFPVYLGVLYVVGVVPLVVEAGPGIMRDFGDVDGVLGLLRDPDVALIAWIHILAFDHLIGVLIYRDNMRHRFVPLPVQSVLLFLTLMFGPVGFVSYYLIRTARRRRAEAGLDLGAPTAAAHGHQPEDAARAGPVAFGAAGTERQAPATTPVPRTVADLGARARAAFAREPALAAIGAAGLVVASLCLVAVAIRGPFIPPEGKMLDAATFTFGVAIFTLTVALLLPLAGYSEPARRRYRRAFFVFPGYGFVIEPLQAFRGLDPRFSVVGGPADQIAGAVFGLTAIIVTVLFVLLGLRFFRRGTLRDSPALRLGIRYGVLAVAVSFGVGILMSAGGGRVIGEAGNLLPAHGLGVHGIQALPLVALLAAWGAMGSRATPLLHAAGLGWLTACAAALTQALLGRPPLDASPFTALMLAGIATWAIAAGFAFVAWRVTARVQPVAPAVTVTKAALATERPSAPVG